MAYQIAVLESPPFFISLTVSFPVVTLFVSIISVELNVEARTGKEGPIGSVKIQIQILIKGCGDRSAGVVSQGVFPQPGGRNIAGGGKRNCSRIARTGKIAGEIAFVDENGAHGVDYTGSLFGSQSLFHGFRAASLRIADLAVTAGREDGLDLSYSIICAAKPTTIGAAELVPLY